MDIPPPERQAVFDRLRPVCVQLTKEHTRENIAILTKDVRNIDKSSVQYLQEYLLFPLRIMLKQPTKYSDELYTDLYKCMEIILSKSRMSKWEMFQDIFNTSCIMLAPPANQGKVSDISEELKLALVRNLTTLVKGSDFHIIKSLYAVPSLPVLGHAVSVILNLAENEKARVLKIAAMNCLQELSQVDDKYCSKVKIMLGDTFASFLPGVSISLSHIITGDTKQGQNVISTAIHVLTRIIKLVLDDQLIKESQTKGVNSQQVKTDDRLQKLVIKRNEQWVKNTDEKMTILMKQIVSVRSHSSWKVRLALVEMAGVMLQHCTKSLKDCMSMFLEVLVGLISDEYPNVASRSRTVLEIFSQTHSGLDCKSLVEILEENLHNLTTSLPRQIRVTDEDQKLAIVNLLSGYISLLGPNINSLFMSVSHLKRLSLSLIQVLEFDCSDIKIVEERTHITGHGTSALQNVQKQDTLRPRKYFKHFHDPRILQELKNVCRLLGYYGNLNLLIDHFLDIFHETSLHRMQATFIINEIILGTAGIEDSISLTNKTLIKKYTTDELESIISMLVEEYMSPSNFDLITNPVQEEENMSPDSQLKALSLILTDTENNVNTFNRNILQICLYLEGLGTFAKVLREKYIPLLMHTLYPLLEKLGDEKAFISNTAYNSLCDIYTACHYNSIDELIKKNVDYLVNAISLRLRHFMDNRRSPTVLKVIIQYSDADILPYIDDTIQEILSSLDEYYSEQASLFMGVLNELIKAVVRWFPPQHNNDFHKDKNSAKTTKLKNTSTLTEDTVQNLTSFFLDYHQQKQIADGKVDDDHDDDGDDSKTGDAEIGGDNDDTENDEKKQPPQHVLIVKEVMFRSKHLLSSKNPRLRLMVLDTIGHACLALQSVQNELLPLIHEVWPPFSVRFTDEEKLVTKKAIEVLSVMADVSGDFIQHRTVKDILPKIINFLGKQAQISNHSGPAYTYTVNYKLQHTILTHIGHICQKLGIEENNLDKISSACVIYLSSRQPVSLQKVAVTTCCQLAELEPDSLWLKLCDLYCPCDYNVPSPVFREVKFYSQPGKRNEYTDNVIEVLRNKSLIKNFGKNEA